MSGSYTDLRVWQKAMALAVDVHQCTSGFPKRALWGRAIQMERAAISVPSNIAEGKGRRTDRDALNFFYTARGSLYELETQIMLARELKYMTPEQATALLSSLATVVQWLDRSDKRIRSRRSSGRQQRVAPDAVCKAFLSGRRP